MDTHPERTQFNSLTSLSDLPSYPPPVDQSNEPCLTDKETKEATKELLVNIIRKYPVLDKYYNDPELKNQDYCLHSFVPAKGAKPDKDGVFGMMKCRGTFATQKDAEERATYIIKNADSYHKIYTSFVGKPFPVTENSKFVEEINEIALKEKTDDVVSADIKSKAKEEKAVFEDLQKRKKEFELLSNASMIEDIDEYITSMVTRGNMDVLIGDLDKKKKEYEKIRDKAFDFIKEADKENPDFRDKFIDIYMSKCKEVGIGEENNQILPHMRRYKVEDYSS